MTSLPVHELTVYVISLALFSAFGSRQRDNPKNIPWFSVTSLYLAQVSTVFSRSTQVLERHCYGPCFSFTRYRASNLDDSGVYKRPAQCKIDFEAAKILSKKIKEGKKARTLHLDVRIALQVHGVHLPHDVRRCVDSFQAHLLAQRLVLSHQFFNALGQHLILALQPDPLLLGSLDLELEGVWGFEEADGSEAHVAAHEAGPGPGRPGLVQHE